LAARTASLSVISVSVSARGQDKAKESRSPEARDIARSDDRSGNRLPNK